MTTRTLLTALLIAAPPILGACESEPHPPDRSRAVLNLYTHRDGKTKCVTFDDDRLMADPGCCPTGFSVAGFATPTATAYHHPEDGVKKYQYRHVVCLEDPPPVPTPPTP